MMFVYILVQLDQKRSTVIIEKNLEQIQSKS